VEDSEVGGAAEDQGEVAAAVPTFPTQEKAQLKMTRRE